jgi:hypothetical protein
VRIAGERTPYPKAPAALLDPTIAA